KGSLLTIGAQGGFYSLMVWMPQFLRAERKISIIGSTPYLMAVIGGAFVGYLTGGGAGGQVRGPLLFFRLPALPRPPALRLHPSSVPGQRHAGARLPARVLRLGVLLRGPAVPQRAVRHARARRRRRLHLQRRPGGRRALSLPGRRGVRSDAAVRRDQLVCG